MRSRSLTTHYVRLMGWKDATSLGDFSALSIGMIMTTLQIHGQCASERAKGPKDRLTWEKKGGCCQDQLLLYFSSFWWQIVIHPIEVEHSFHRQQMMLWYVSWIASWYRDRMWHIKFVDPGLMLYEDVGFGFDISDGSTLVGHCFVRRVGIRSTV